jgi:hypothetical protein
MPTFFLANYDPFITAKTDTRPLKEKMLLCVVKIITKAYHQTMQGKRREGQSKVSESMLHLYHPLGPGPAG